jgi:hypothetical protein
MSAAVCSFGVANPLANPKFSPNYDLGVPYPLIYADRKTVTGEDRYYRFSSDNPDGEAVETLSESEYSTVVEHENNNNIRGHIVGGVIGGVAFIVIFVAIPLWLWLRNRRAKNTAIIAPGQKLGETRRQPSIKASDDPPPAYEQIATPAPIYQQSST